MKVVLLFLAFIVDGEGACLPDRVKYLVYNMIAKTRHYEYLDFTRNITVMGNLVGYSMFLHNETLVANVDTRGTCHSARFYGPMREQCVPASLFIRNETLLDLGNRRVQVATYKVKQGDEEIRTISFAWEAPPVILVEKVFRNESGELRPVSIVWNVNRSGDVSDEAFRRPDNCVRLGR